MFERLKRFVLPASLQAVDTLRVGRLVKGKHVIANGMLCVIKGWGKTHAILEILASTAGSGRAQKGTLQVGLEEMRAATEDEIQLYGALHK